MSKLSKFLQNAELIKGRKPAPAGTLSKDGKRRKAADGTWKPIKRQRKGKSAPKRKGTMSVSKVELGTGKVISTEEREIPKFTRGAGKPKGPTPKEQNEALKRRIDANVELSLIHI